MESKAPALVMPAMLAIPPVPPNIVLLSPCVGPSSDPALALATEPSALALSPAGLHAEIVAASAADDNKDNTVTVFTVQVGSMQRILVIDVLPRLPAIAWIPADA